MGQVARKSDFFRYIGLVSRKTDFFRHIFASLQKHLISLNVLAILQKNLISLNILALLKEYPITLNILALLRENLISLDILASLQKNLISLNILAILQKNLISLNILALLQENLILFYANNKGADQPAQADLHLCYSLSWKKNIYTYNMKNFHIIGSSCTSAGCFEPNLVAKGTWWLSGKVLDSGSRGCGFESHQRHCNVSLSKTLYPMLSTGSTREDPFRHDRKMLTGM